MMIKFIRLRNIQQVAQLADCVTAYAVNVHDTQDTQSLMLELVRAVHSEDQIVIAGVDGEARKIVAYALAKIFDDHEGRTCYVVQLFAQRGLGHDIYDAVVDWAKANACVRMIAFVDLPHAAAAARLWHAEPSKLLLERRL